MLYTQDIPHIDIVIMAIFPDDTAVLAVDENIYNTTDKLQSAMNKVSGWTKR
jgi:hypothetical protein